MYVKFGLYGRNGRNKPLQIKGIWQQVRVWKKTMKAWNSWIWLNNSWSPIQSAIFSKTWAQHITQMSPSMLHALTVLQWHQAMAKSFAGYKWVIKDTLLQSALHWDPDFCPDPWPHRHWSGFAICMWTLAILECLWINMKVLFYKTCLYSLILHIHPLHWEIL